MKDPEKGIKELKLEKDKRVFNHCFTGTNVIDWLVSSSSIRNRKEGLLLASSLLSEGYLQPAGDTSKAAAEGLSDTPFLDLSDAYYYFPDSGFFCEGYSSDDDVVLKEEFRGTIVKQGCLLKQGHRRKNWKVRKFVLRDDPAYLHYYDPAGGEEPLGAIHLRGCVVTAVEDMPDKKNQEGNAEEAPAVHAVEMSCIPLLMEPACSCSEVQGATKKRNNDAASRLSIPLPDDNESKQSKSIPRKRVLPSWMLERDLMQKVSKPVMTGDSRKQKGQRWAEGHTESLKSEVHVQQRKRSASEETIEDFEGDEQDQRKRSCLSIPVPLSQNTSGLPLETTMRHMEGSGNTGTKVPGSSLEKNDRQLHSKWSKRVGQISSKDNRIEETENKEQITGSTSQQAHWGRISQYFSAQEGSLEPDTNLDYNTEISDSTRSADASENSKQMQHKRTPCMYGSGCYRKNPIHFQQFSHPNDDGYHDMAMVAKDDNDNRPECPYGTACYRKNPQHKLEYKHSAAPVTGRGTQQRTSRNGKSTVEKDSVNDGEANHSFIDDDEEDEECEPTDEDSDWEPSSEEKDNEDAETPVQKTRRFVRIKK